MLFSNFFNFFFLQISNFIILMSHQSDEDIHKGRNISLGTPRSRLYFVCDFFSFRFFESFIILICHSIAVMLDLSKYNLSLHVNILSVSPMAWVNRRKLISWQNSLTGRLWRDKIVYFWTSACLIFPLYLSPNWGESFYESYQ